MSVQPTANMSVQPARRLESLDLLRGFALCGILLVNIMLMGGSWEQFHPVLPATLANPNWVVWIVQHLFVQGSMRGMFTLLFGAGMLLITLRGEDGRGTIQSADVYFRRCMVLLALGIFNATVLLFPGDILYVYGLSGFLLFVFRMARPRTLIAISAAMLLMLTVESAVVGAHQAVEARRGAELAVQVHGGAVLTGDDAEALKAYTRAREAQVVSPEVLAEERAARTGGPVSLLKWSVRTWLDYAASSYTITLVIETVAFMLLGMALFKLGVLSGARSLRFYLALAAGGYAVGLAVNGAQALVLWSSQFSSESFATQASYELGRCAMTLGHVGLLLSLWKMNALGFVGRALRNLGRMALTNYLGQSAIAAVLFYGFGLWGRLDWGGLWALAAGIWVFQMIFSTLWLKRFNMGPLEWALRWFAYGRPSPLKREKAA
ncbi:DUF418 domain-containing protein [Brevundimonas diminuta]|uniref:DUF418 domain-containing protein n=1 Tax=Brevundimonas diminuta TaxID=293 RepID=UPI00320835EE